MTASTNRTVGAPPRRPAVLRQLSTAGADEPGPSAPACGPGSSPTPAAPAFARGHGAAGLDSATGGPSTLRRVTVEALESERARPDPGERMAKAAPYNALADLDRLIGVLAGAMLSRPPNGHQAARDERAAEYARLRDAGFSRAQAAEEIQVHSRTTIGRYERLRTRGAA